MQWQSYVERYPIASLAVVALLGVAVGRRIARGSNGNAYRGDGRQWTSAAAGMDLVARLPARLEPPGADRFAAVTASWQRLSARVEGLVNRIIDDVADVAKHRLVPALVGGIQAFIERRGAGPAHRTAPPDRTSASAAEEGRLT